jgi:hypothetical protein
MYDLLYGDIISIIYEMAEEVKISMAPVRPFYLMS